MTPQGKLLFEAFVNITNSYTAFYYIELFNSAYVLKKGISLLGATIKPNETNRLNIVCVTKDEYEAFVKKFQDGNESMCGYGNDDTYHWYYRFMDETDDKTMETKVRTTNEIIMTIEGFYNTQLGRLKHNSKKITVDVFPLDDAQVEIMHDPTCVELTKQEKQELIPDKTIPELVNKYFNGYKESEYEYIVEKYNLMMRQKDLLKEMLYVYENDKYPDQMIVVEGWTSKDMIECASWDIAESYFHLMNLRENPTEEREYLHEMFCDIYSGLYEQTELAKRLEEFHSQINKVQEENETVRTHSTESKPTVDQWINCGHGARLVSPMAQQIANEHKSKRIKKFLSLYTIEMIRQDLAQYIIGQDELIESVSTFLYYHALRQVNKKLYPRPILIAGPSGSGKTEIFRVIKKLYSDYFTVEIVDGSIMTKDGWKGDRKISTILPSLEQGAILVIDEFDKLAQPEYDGGNANVSFGIQSEFLKLLEGEYYTKDLKQKNTINSKSKEINYDVSTLGIVLVGAFEAIRSKKENPSKSVGFNFEAEASVTTPEAPEAKNNKNRIVITDEDLVEYGVVTELVGRLSDKITTNKLTTEEYVAIIQNQNSKVNLLIQELKELGIDTDDIVTPELIVSLVEESQVNLLGVRWVSSQVESKLLQTLSSADLRTHFTEPEI